MYDRDMAKKRTKSSKVRARARRGEAVSASGFKVSFSAIESSKTQIKRGAANKSELNFFRIDLTKVILLTMLALALEIALWLYLPR